MKLKKNYINTLLLVFLTFSFWSQSYRMETIKETLEKQTTNHPNLNEKLNLKVDDISVVDFLRGIGKQHQLNLTIQDDIQGDITTSYFDAKIKDVLINICQEYKLDLEFIGSVIYVKKYIEPKQTIVVEKKVPSVNYNSANTFLTVNLQKDTLFDVVKEIAKKSGANVICEKTLNNEVISGFIQNRPLPGALQKLADINQLDLEIVDSFYIFRKPIIEVNNNRPANSTNNSTRARNNNQRNTNSQIQVNNGIISIQGEDILLADIISEVMDKLGENYIFYDRPTEKTSIFVDNLNQDQFLEVVLKGTKYSHTKTDDIYLIGEHKAESMTKTKLIQLKYRTIEAALDLIPPSLTKDIHIKEYPSLNGYIVNATDLKINQLEQALEEIDKVTPMVTIEVMIIESTKGNTLSGGVSAGLGSSPNTTVSTGTITPGANINLSTNAINDLINSINGFGSINLGNVGPNFYLNVEALEANQNIKIESVPKLSTLNSEQATLTIGATEYYVQQNTQLVNAGAGNQNLLQTVQYKPVNADLTITITPFVSSDEQVTMNIDVSQSDFTARIADDAPPGSVTRSFKSIIRVKNEDMILLGGLEQKSRNNSGTGLPWLARIPVIKWFFGKRIKERKKTRLSILIKPTISY